jgi:hypothetical protein
VKVTELLQSMLANDPTARPTAAYIAVALPDATVAQDWHECRDVAVGAVLRDDYETALTWYMRAVACTPEHERTGSAFAQILRDTLEATESMNKTREYLPQLTQPALQAICHGEHKPGAGSEDPFEHLGRTLIAFSRRRMVLVQARMDKVRLFGTLSISWPMRLRLPAWHKSCRGC